MVSAAWNLLWQNEIRTQKRKKKEKEE